MTYNLLYIEDQNAETIISELKNHGFNVTHHTPGQFEATINQISEGQYHAILLDYRLTGGEAIFDAPTVAQTVRTKHSNNHRDIPIFLISTEDRISGYYKDFTSQDLFDFSVSKNLFLEEIEKYALRIKKFIEAYGAINENNFNLQLILDMEEEKFKDLDYRISEKLKNEYVKDDIYAYSKLVYNQIVRSIGVLIGEDVLSARLGVSKDSPDWNNLKSRLERFKYTGIFSESYDRWWSADIDKWWKEMFGPTSSLRRLNASQRVEKLIERTELNNLTVLDKAKFATSTNFWTICKELKVALDPIDGLELHHKELFPWQEKEYISILAGLESSDLLQYVKPVDKKKLREIAGAL